MQFFGLNPTNLIQAADAVGVLTGAYVASDVEGATISFGVEPAAGERRFIVVVATGNANNVGEITDISIGGSSGVMVVSAENDASSDNSAAIAYREVPTGTSGTVSFTASPVASFDRVHVYRLITTEDGDLAVTDAGSDIDASNPMTVNLDIAAGGFAIGGACGINSGTFTWTNLTEDDDTDMSGSSENSAAASDSFVSEQIDLTIETAPAVATGAYVMAAASFQISQNVDAVHITNQDSASDASNSTTYTFSSQNLGTASAGREILIATAARAGASRSVDSLTVAGVSATKVAEALNGSGGFESAVSIWRAAVPSGTTGDVVVTYSGAMLWSAISVYSMLNAAAGVKDAGSDVNLNPCTDSIFVVNNGAALGISMHSAGTATTWTGLTEDVDAIAEGTQGYSSAHQEFSGLSSHILDVESAWTGSSFEAMALASFGPKLS